MKNLSKTLKLFIATTAVLFISTIVFLVLFINANKTKNQFVGFSNSCISSFMTSVDLTLCEEDMFLENVKPGACTQYKDKVTKDFTWAKSIGYTNQYNYIGAGTGK